MPRGRRGRLVRRLFSGEEGPPNQSSGSGSSQRLSRLQNKASQRADRKLNNHSSSNQKDPNETSHRAIARSVGLLCETFVALKIKEKTVQYLRNKSRWEKDVDVDELGIPLRPNDIQQMILAENGRLNDEMVNRTMNFLNKKHPLQHEDGKQSSWDSHAWKVEALQTYWFKRIGEKKASGSRKHHQYPQWITNWMDEQGFIKGKRPRLDCVMIPCYHYDLSHWTLALVFPKRHKIAILDSLEKAAPAGRDIDVYDHICMWLHTYMEDGFNKEKWALLHLPCPQQQNLHDCGIHVALNAWVISKGIWPIAHENLTPGDRRLYVAYMANKGTRKCPVGIL